MLPLANLAEKPRRASYPPSNRRS